MAAIGRAIEVPPTIVANIAAALIPIPRAPPFKASPKNDRSSSSTGPPVAYFLGSGNLSNIFCIFFGSLVLLFSSKTTPYSARISKILLGIGPLFANGCVFIVPPSTIPPAAYFLVSGNSPNTSCIVFGRLPVLLKSSNQGFFLDTFSLITISPGINNPCTESLPGIPPLTRPPAAIVFIEYKSSFSFLKAVSAFLYFIFSDIFGPLPSPSCTFTLLSASPNFLAVSGNS